jgi:hypothetical protein
MRPVLKSVSVRFLEDDALEYAVLYQHAEGPPTPGSKTRTRQAGQMVRKGLTEALESLEGDLTWGGFATNTRTSRDVVVADRRGRAA